MWDDESEITLETEVVESEVRFNSSPGSLLRFFRHVPYLHGTLQGGCAAYLLDPYYNASSFACR
jgi:hypothetical protein